MKQKKFFIAVGVAISTLITFYAGAAWWAGKATQLTVQKQLQWLQNQPYLRVKHQSYHRGWFTSDATTTLVINPNLYTFILRQVGQQNLPNFEVTYRQHIKHGPFPLLTAFNPTPYKAVIVSDLLFSPPLQKRLNKIFGQAKPLTILEYIAFRDESKALISSPEFDYEEAVSGLRIKWSGFKGNMEYRGKYSERFTLNGAVKSAFAEANAVTINLNNLAIYIDKLRNQSSLILGTQILKIDTLSLNRKSASWLDIYLSQISYGTTVDQKGNYINAEGKFDIKSFKLGSKPYGPFELVGQAQHLYAPALTRLSTKLDQLQKNGIEITLTEEIMQLLFDYGLPLLEHNPELCIPKLFLRTPDGDIYFTAKLILKGFKKDDIKTPLHVLEKIEARADISIPRQALETGIVLQAQTIFGSEGDDNEDMKLLIRDLINGQISKLVQEKYIEMQGNNIIAHIALKDGKLTLNDIPVLMPWQRTVAH